jgi:CheY-like chemotaxis protein
VESHTVPDGLTRPYRVAIVDDHVDVRELLAVRLTMVQGLEVIGQAANGVEAIGLARSLGPDLMTLDLRMPVMGGAEAIPLLRAAAPHMRIVVFSAQDATSDLTRGHSPDASIAKGSNLADLVAVITGLLSEGPLDVVQVDLGRLPVNVVVEAFDSWIGLNARVRDALATKGDVSVDLLGDVPVDPSDLVCLMGVFMQMGLPLLASMRKGDLEVELKFAVRRAAGAGARRALLALGGNGSLRAFNKAWSHSPTLAARQALDLVDSRLVDQLPAS